METLKSKTMKVTAWTTKSAIALAAIALISSCCKQYSCTCYNQNDSVDQVRTAQTKKPNAEAWCAELDRQQAKSKQGYCTLKRE